MEEARQFPYRLKSVRVSLPTRMKVLPALLILLTGYTPKGTEVCFPDTICIEVKIKDTPESKAIGLMNYTYLEEHKGMLFILEEKGKYPFWMENMSFPIDIIW